jgi:hypothetical protein
LRALETRGCRRISRGLYACGVSMHTPPKAYGWRPAERRGAYGLSGGGRRLLHELGGCPVEARAAGGRLLLETPFGVYAVEPVVVAARGVHTGGGMPREAAGPLRRRGGCEDAGLE